MKHCFFIFVFMTAIVAAGAGCSDRTTVVSQTPSAKKEALIQRRVADPPAAPTNIPAPTPVQPTGTAQ